MKESEKKLADLIHRAVTVGGAVEDIVKVPELRRVLLAVVENCLTVKQKDPYEEKCIEYMGAVVYCDRCRWLLQWCGLDGKETR